VNCNVSAQADSEERDQVFLETNLIDMKFKNVDIYDTQKLKPTPKKKIGFLEYHSVGTHIENRINAFDNKDWFFSDLHRRLLN
jgi:hypothetical protein